MAILNIPYNQPPASTIGQLFNSANAPAIAKAEKGLETQASTIVTLSVQGQKLSLASNTQTAQVQNSASKTGTEQSGSAQNSQTGTAQTSQNTQSVNVPSQNVQARSQQTQNIQVPLHQNTGTQNPGTQNPNTQNSNVLPPSTHARNNQSLNDAYSSNLNNPSQTSNSGTQNRTASNSIDSYAREGTEPTARETVETTGAQRQEGESKGRNINVYA